MGFTSINSQLTHGLSPTILSYESVSVRPGYNDKYRSRSYHFVEVQKLNVRGWSDSQGQLLHITDEPVVKGSKPTLQGTSQPTMLFAFREGKLVAELLQGRGKMSSDGEEISATVTKLYYWKVAVVQTCHSPATFIGYTTPFTFTITRWSSITKHFLYFHLWFIS